MIVYYRRNQMYEKISGFDGLVDIDDCVSCFLYRMELGIK